MALVSPTGLSDSGKTPSLSLIRLSDNEKELGFANRSLSSLSHVIAWIRYLTMALSVLAVLSLANLAYGAGRVFHDDFEDGTANKWTQSDYHTKAKIVQAGVDGNGPHSGNACLQINFNGVIAWNDPDAFTAVKLDNWSYNKEFFIRMWWRLDNDFGRGMSEPGDGAKLMRLNFDNGNDYATFMLQGGGSHEQWTVDSGLIINNWSGDGGKLLSQRVWHKVEIYVYQDSISGKVKRWHNGILTYTYTGKTNNSNNVPYYPLYLPSNWSNNPGWEHGANNHFYVDDVEIYSDSGTGASGVMADATITSSVGSQTVPSAPQNARVTSAP